MKPELIKGGIAFDDRGYVSFANDFSFDSVKRFYLVDNYSAIIAAVEIDDWDQPNKDAEVHRWVLSAGSPGVISIPAGYANGFMSLEPHTTLAYFSTSTLEQSVGDDFRYPFDYWNPWEIEPR
jgi:hypothetical protein